MHDAADTGRARRVEQVSRAIDVDGLIGRIGLPRLPIGRRNVVHDLDVGAGARKRRWISQIAVGNLHHRRQIAELRPARLANEPTNRLPRLDEMAHQASAREPARARYENLHRWS
ncbi:MAG: hypothetical protein QF634_14700 [Vicinamibacterales bacterium]|nr:hypothetical protein [Vicinamibacterales bacterium]